MSAALALEPDVVAADRCQLQRVLVVDENELLQAGLRLGAEKVVRIVQYDGDPGRIAEFNSDRGDDRPGRLGPAQGEHPPELRPRAPPRLFKGL